MKLMNVRFIVTKELGNGSFRTLVFDSQTNTHYVVQMFNHQFDAKERALAVIEIAILRSVNHPNVVKFYGAWIEVDRCLHLLFEYCDVTILPATSSLDACITAT